MRSGIFLLHAARCSLVILSHSWPGRLSVQMLRYTSFGAVASECVLAFLNILQSGLDRTLRVSEPSLASLLAIGCGWLGVEIISCWILAWVMTPEYVGANSPSRNRRALAGKNETGCLSSERYCPPRCPFPKVLEPHRKYYSKGMMVSYYIEFAGLRFSGLRACP